MELRCDGIIFDFNGTLFFDTEKPEQAWNTVSFSLRGHPFDPEEMDEHVHGRNGKSIFEYLLGREIDLVEERRLVEQKEQIYRALCLEDDVNFHLAPGVHELLDFITEHHIPTTIATASGRTNLDFFIRQFRLDRWFKPERIVYDDGTLKGKPDPDIYLRAAQRIGVVPQFCMVIEDAFSGIESARQAGIGRIIAIAPAEEHEFMLSIPGVHDVIIDFAEFDTSVFNLPS